MDECGQLWLWTYAWSQISPNVIMMCRVTLVRCTWTKGGWVSKQATQYSGGSLLRSRMKSRSSRGVGSIAKSWFKTTSENLIKMSNLIFSKGLGRWHHQPQPWLWKQICQQCHQCWGAQLWLCLQQLATRRNTSSKFWKFFHHRFWASVTTRCFILVSIWNSSSWSG